MHCQHLLRHTTLPVHGEDNRRMGAVVNGLPLFHGRPLFCDATVRSPLKGDGTPHPKAATENGAVLRRAKADKEAKYQDLHSSSMAELIVLACEVGGRWNEDAVSLVRALAKLKTANTHPLLRRLVELA